MIINQCAFGHASAARGISIKISQSNKLMQANKFRNLNLSRFYQWLESAISAIWHFSEFFGYVYFPQSNMPAFGLYGQFRSITHKCI